MADGAEFAAAGFKLMSVPKVRPPVAMLSERVRDAVARKESIRILGTGEWMDAGRPVSASKTISTRELSGIVEYVPGDLTLTALAGTTLADISAATAPHGQWLALDPHGSNGASIGATIATASHGPLATTFGTPRDLVLGVEVVTGTGAVVRGGGRVVKNVAGFDLTRLMTGAWGTLGIITEVTVRLHARPETTLTLAVALSPRGDDSAVVRSANALRRLPFTPFAFEILNAPLARLLDLSDDVTLLVKLGGNAEAVAAQREAMGELGDARVLDDSVWTRFRAIEPPNSMTMRLSNSPSEIERSWRAADEIARRCPETLIHATPKRGVVRCVIPPGPGAVDRVRSWLESGPAGVCVGERLPAEAWQLLASPVSDKLSRGIRTAFDPERILNPGILGEEI